MRTKASIFEQASVCIWLKAIEMMLWAHLSLRPGNKNMVCVFSFLFFFNNVLHLYEKTMTTHQSILCCVILLLSLQLFQIFSVYKNGPFTARKFSMKSKLAQFLTTDFVYPCTCEGGVFNSVFCLWHTFRHGFSPA